ncbi:MAG: hypothetical protein F6K42_02255 [Leptolyngbya sp. SIO1D8]|nr:hypothetical protein [Leptolyngbya sp. SIO1D8]
MENSFPKAFFIPNLIWDDDINLNERSLFWPESSMNAFASLRSRCLIRTLQRFAARFISCAMLKYALINY